MGRVLPFPVGRVRRGPLPDGERTGRLLLFTGVRYERMTVPSPRPARRRPRKSGG